MSKFIILFFILLISCSQVEPQEIQILQEIINRDFKDCPTYHQLIPIKREDLKGYSEYRKSRDKNGSKEIPRTAEPPPPAPDSNRRINVPVGSILFSNLIRHAQISEIQYEKLVTKCNLIDGLTNKFQTDHSVKENFAQIMAIKTVDRYQEFGYPILAGDTIIIYRNYYTDIKSSDKLGLNGYGIYFVYSKIDQEWIQTYKVTKWIT